MHKRILFLLYLLLPLLAISSASHGEIVIDSPYSADDGITAESLIFDGEVLLRLRGISSTPARRRVDQARIQLLSIAKNPDINTLEASIQTVDNHIELAISGRHILNLYQADADMEGVPLNVLAEAAQGRLVRAIIEWRESRSLETLTKSTLLFIGLSFLSLLLVWIIRKVFGWINNLIERQVKTRLEKIEQVSHRTIDSAQLWNVLGNLVSLLRIITTFVIALAWLNTSLGLYPWTRPFASTIFSYLIDPLKEIITGLISTVPDLIFLAILFFILRFVIKVTREFFIRINQGIIRLESFDPDWAMPTYRIVRTGIIAFGLVVAYPYIPGSGSQGFKGISIFLGLILSLGSSSFIANIIAGYSLIYRSAYSLGDRIKIGEHTGDVIEMKSHSTKLLSPKNEEINIPNSVVITSPVVNYSKQQRNKGLILHTEIGIGYDAPWRQVEAMLLQAAEKTQYLLKHPKPFVLQLSLQDFTVIYQLNAYCDDATKMNSIYSDLHAHIQDAFNENEVQIMSPHYENDPSTPKIVPKDKWHTDTLAGTTATNQQV